MEMRRICSPQRSAFSKPLRLSESQLAGTVTGAPLGLRLFAPFCGETFRIETTKYTEYTNIKAFIPVRVVRSWFCFSWIDYLWEHEKMIP